MSQNKLLKNEGQNNEKDTSNESIPKKGPLNFIIGSLTSFSLCLFSYLISNNIAIYFSNHKPTNSSEIVEKISSSISTLIIGLSFLLIIIPNSFKCLSDTSVGEPNIRSSAC